MEHLKSTDKRNDFDWSVCFLKLSLRAIELKS